jgi:predicted site-specific integrase-resolvase
MRQQPKLSNVAPPVPSWALLLTRQQVGTMLNISVATVIRWERKGILHAVRPTGIPGSKVFYRMTDVISITQRDAE